MTSIKKIAAALVFFGAVGGAQAANITNASGTYSFSGFDWDKFGSVRISDYGLTGASAVGTTDNFNLTYQAFATALYDGNGNVLSLPGLRQGTGAGYEYTIIVKALENATMIAPGFAALNVLGGTFEIFYQALGDVNRIAGTGYTNGTKILGGTLLSSLVPGGSNTVFAPQGPSNPGNVSLSASLKATMSYQDMTYVSPLLVSSDATTTLQFGNTINTGWVRPGQIADLVLPGLIATATSLVRPMVINHLQFLSRVL